MFSRVLNPTTWEHFPLEPLDLNSFNNVKKNRSKLMNTYARGNQAVDPFRFGQLLQAINLLWVIMLYVMIGVVK